MTPRLSYFLQELDFVLDEVSEGTLVVEGDARESLETAHIILTGLLDGTFTKDTKPINAWGKAGLEANRKRFKHGKAA